MNDKRKNKRSLTLTKGIKIAAIYLVIAGGMSLLLPLTGLGSQYPEFQAKSLAYKLGSYTKEHLINILFLISGIGILCSKAWAREMALVILVIGVIYSSNEFAWGFSSDPPSSTVRLFSFLFFCLWNGVWFYLIYRVKPIDMKTENG